MTAGLETFAKVRALHDRTDSPGERDAAAGRMEALARAASMTTAEAVSKLDGSKRKPRAAQKSQAQATADAFNDFFSRPEFVAQRAAREEQRRERCADLLRQYGSEDAVFTETACETACRLACEPLRIDDPRPEWSDCYSLDGWPHYGGAATMPASVREAVSQAWPLPPTVAAAWVEFQATDALDRARCAFAPEYTPHQWVEAWGYVVKGLLNELPAKTLEDLRARGAWLAFQADREVSQRPDEHRTLIATLRADIERMGARLREQDAEPVQTGQGRWGNETVPHSTSPDPGTSTDTSTGTSAAPGQTGHRPSTRAERRAAARALLVEGLTDREIARRVGISPTTVGSLRRKRA